MRKIIVLSVSLSIFKEIYSERKMYPRHDSNFGTSENEIYNDIDTVQFHIRAYFFTVLYG